MPSHSILGISEAEQGREAMPAESTFVKAHGTLSFSQDLARRVLKLEERLLGQRPTESSKTGGTEAPIPMGTFNELRFHSAQTFEDIDRAMAALDRIEKQLP